MLTHWCTSSLNPVTSYLMLPKHSTRRYSSRIVGGVEIDEGFRRFRNERSLVWWVEWRLCFNVVNVQGQSAKLAYVIF